MPTIDIHAHFVDRHYLDGLTRVMRLDAEDTADGKRLLRERGATIAWTRPDMFDVEHRLADMAEKHIDMRVLSVSAPNVYPFPAGEQTAMRATSTMHSRAIAARIRTGSSTLRACRSPMSMLRSPSSTAPCKSSASTASPSAPISAACHSTTRLRAVVGESQRAAPASGRASGVPARHIRHG
jgi:hypothetical protein